MYCGGLELIRSTPKEGGLELFFRLGYHAFERIRVHGHMESGGLCGGLEKTEWFLWLAAGGNPHRVAVQGTIWLQKHAAHHEPVTSVVLEGFPDLLKARFVELCQGHGLAGPIYMSRAMLQQEPPVRQFQNAPVFIDVGNSCRLDNLGGLGGGCHSAGAGFAAFLPLAFGLGAGFALAGCSSGSGFAIFPGPAAKGGCGASQSISTPLAHSRAFH